LLRHSGLNPYTARRIYLKLRGRLNGGANEY
jgi:hypothetical protein